MSLLGRRAPHVAYVQNREYTRNARGLQEWVDVGEPILVKCKLEPVRDWSSVEEERTLGLQVIDLAIVYSKVWPGNVHSHVLYGGALYETVGTPQHFATSKRTSHWRTTIKWIKKVG